MASKRKITNNIDKQVEKGSVITYLSDRIQISYYSNPSFVYVIMMCSYRIFPIIGFVLLLISILFYSRALSPNLMSNDEDHNKCYPLFFGDISSEDLDKYKRKMHYSNDSDFLEELIYETHFNSRLCSKKMKSFKLGFIFSILSVVLAILTLGIKYFLSM